MFKSIYFYLFILVQVFVETFQVFIFKEEQNIFK